MAVPDGSSTAPEHAASTPLGEFDGRELRALRKARALSLTQLSEATELSVGYLSQVERNISTPSPKALGAIARALGVTVGWFFEYRKNKPPFRVLAAGSLA